jgi:hypothetical protein
MQDEYYKNDPAYQKKPWTSVHEVGRGADVSLKFFTPEEINLIYRFINTHFVYNNKLSVALVHDVGLGSHLHLQIPDGNLVVKNS